MFFFVCIKPHILCNNKNIKLFSFLLPHLPSSIGILFLSAEMVCFSHSLPTQDIAHGRWIVVHIRDYKSFCHSQTVINLSAYMGDTTIQ